MLPEWAKKTERYEPDGDRDAFAARSLLRVLEVLTALRAQAGRRQRGGADACLALTVIIILGIVAARTTAFLWAVLGGELVILCFLPGVVLRRRLALSLVAAGFCLLLILPAWLLWGPGPYLLLPLRTFLTVTALSLLQERFSWHELTGALRQFHVPQELIFLLDTTLRYLLLLGEQASELLTALHLRSIGHNRHKGSTLTNIIGILLQRAHRLSLTMDEAMRCRGFTGSYPPAAAARSARAYLLPAGLFLLYGYLFLALEGLWR